MAFTPINIAFELTGSTLQQCKAIQEELNLNLEGQHYFLEGTLHLTLWMGIIANRDLETVNNIVKEINTNKRFTAQKAALELFQDQILSINIQKTNTLATLQDNIQQKIEPFRKNNNISPSLNQPTLDYLNSSHRTSAIYFDPHITLGFSNTVPFEKIKRFYLEKLHIFEVGNNGTCIPLKTQ